ncbi:MAG: outer membrane protein assembly factor BamB [Enterobacterales bacterium]|jgi:outer membrane protein assembly factor BamB
MKNISLIVIALNVLLVSGCSWFDGDEEDNIFQPAPLPDITKKFSVKATWSSQVGEGVGDYYNKLSPTSYDGKVIAADINGLVSAFDIATGKVIWKTEVGSELFGGVAAGSGIIAVGSTEAEIIILDAKTGTEKWRNLVSSEIVSAPGIGDGKVVVRTVDGKLFALDAKTGVRDWTYDRTVPALTIRGTSSLSLERGVAVTGFANGKIVLFAMNNGRPIWEKRVTNPSGSSELDRMVDADATPVIFGDVVYAVTFNGNIAAFNVKDGTVAWQRELSSYQNMSVGGQIISVTDSRSNVKALDRRTGGTLWTQSSLVDRRLTATIAFGDYLVAGDYEGYIHWFDRSNGRLVSRNSLGGGGIVADPVVVGGIMYIYTRDGSLYSFNAP